MVKNRCRITITVPARIKKIIDERGGKNKSDYTGRCVDFYHNRHKDEYQEISTRMTELAKAHQDIATEISFLAIKKERILKDRQLEEEENRSRNSKENIEENDNESY